MADLVKLQKLAAARKKLKGYQQEKKQKEVVSQGSKSPAESVASSETASEQNGLLTANSTLLTSTEPQLQTYFQDPQMFYDQPTFFTSDTADSTVSFFDQVTQQQNQSDTNKISEDVNAVAIEDPEINPNEIFDFGQEQSTGLTDSDKTEISSPVENLRQLSAQINNLIEPTYDSQDNFSDLEKRNLELASLYEAEKLKNEQTQVELLECRAKIANLEKEVENSGVENRNETQREIGILQEQLQCHMQTVGILVGEKTELSAALTQSQMEAKQKLGDFEELNARLKTSRSRVAELEKELNHFREERSKYSKLDSDFSAVQEKLHVELGALKEEHAEAVQDVAELREKLKKLDEDNHNLLVANKDVSNQLELAQVKIQQLTNGEVSRDDARIEGLVQEKMSLEKQIGELNNAVTAAVNERDQASNHYQQYVQQLNTNVSNLATKLETVTYENENLSKREQELIRHIGELEKRLQTLQSEHVNIKTAPKVVADEEADETRASLKELQLEHGKLQEKFDDLKIERDEFFRESENKKEVISELEKNLERLRGNQTDSSRLLAAIESDKVAASRAVQQNTQLKQQLEEMQDAFIKMTNDKAELVDKLTSEVYKEKELDERMQQYEHQIQTLVDAVKIKDKELTEIRESSTNLSKQVIDQSQLNDRLRHYEAHEHSSQALNNDLHEALQQVAKLKANEDVLQNEIFSLKQRLDVKMLPQVVNGGEHHMLEHSDNKEMAMRQLETKFMNTMKDIANLQDEKQMLEHLVMQLQGETDTIGEYIALYQHQRGVLKQRAHEKEEQLKQLAKDRADVKQQLNKLNDLVKDFMAKKSVHVVEAGKECAEHAPIAQQHEDVVEVVEKGEETAKEIITLLSEIKSSNLVQPSDVSETFHPCSLCSGQLITV
ncbi:PREDICTED: golgin subfamily A member 2 [Nicrophorus vespilloides]|uniref:Golgin subfamily A member 2 n=1 Tax=Nicrophorus vespilloides TaxID=110193 RepID=A0ABM1NBU3_NICVS|nr:PREDICTED: golgin subfamily A member 2 [Nicrophorus vespilloides]